MNKKDKNSIYSVNLTAEDEKIAELEALRERVCGEIEDAMREYARASRRRCFKRPRRFISRIFRDGEFPEL